MWTSVHLRYVLEKDIDMETSAMVCRECSLCTATCATLQGCEAMIPGKEKLTTTVSMLEETLCPTVRSYWTWRLDAFGSFWVWPVLLCVGERVSWLGEIILFVSLCCTPWLFPVLCKIPSKISAAILYIRIYIYIHMNQQNKWAMKHFKHALAHSSLFLVQLFVSVCCLATNVEERVSWNICDLSSFQPH